MDSEKEKVVDSDGFVQRTNNTAGFSLFWQIRRLGYIFWLPLGGGVLVCAWVLIPRWQADYQQQQLTDAFFAECQKVFQDTSQVPRNPEQELRDAEDRRSLTNNALGDWSPKVSALIKDGYWYARIEYKEPKPSVHEQKIGVAVNDVPVDAEGTKREGG